MNSKVKALIILLIGINVILSAWWVLQGDLVFHTDIARDFLALAQIVDHHEFTLLGPRSGGIPGVFHGPLWFYISIPAYIIGNGNPVVIGWLWVLLNLLSLLSCYFVGKKLFDETTGLLSALLLSSFAIGYTKALFNPFGAVLLSPLFLYAFLIYLKNNQLRYLFITLFILGLIIQFQMAFGVPVLALLSGFLLYHFWKKKLFGHLLAYAVLPIPLVTFILFELRHQFLQIKSVIAYIVGHENSGKMPFLQVLVTRLKGLFNDGLLLFPAEIWFLNLFVTVLFGFLFFRSVKNKEFPNRSFYLSFFLFYIGFWIIALLFRGVIWGYYYWPFLPLVIMVVVSSYKVIPKYLAYILVIAIFASNMFVALRDVINAKKTIGTDAGSWKFYEKLANRIYKEGPSEFGYYIFTPDLFGYSPQYAMNYLQKKYPTIKTYPFQKKETTYLIIAPPPVDKQFLNGDWWKTNQVKITDQPIKLTKFDNGFNIEKYHLDQNEIQISSDPNLIHDLHFR